MTYYVKRVFFKDSTLNEVLKRGLTLEEAQAHCTDPETSSTTCAEEENVERTEKYGPWFDCYNPEV